MPRYRVPLLPLLWVYAAAAAWDPRASWARVRGPGAWALLVGVAAVMTVAAAHFAPDAVSLWRLGRIASGWWFS